MLETELPSSENKQKNSEIQTLEDAINPVANDIKTLRNKILEYLPLETKSSKEIADHIFESSGKMIRPALYFMTCKMLGYQGEHLYPIGAVAEYVHTASLLHDDVVDSSSLRRNKKTANTIWGDQSAILVGDLIYSRASELMAETNHMELVRSFARAIRKMSEGELIQLENVFSMDISEKTYMKILDYKTGVLIGASCRAGGILSGANDSQLDALENFGHKIGVAFQLIDDALDYVANQKVFGKKTHSDLLEGKVTMPVILLRELASPEEISTIEKIVSDKQITSEQVTQVASYVSKYNTSFLTIQKAGEITKEALSLIQDNFPDSESRTHMENLAKTLLSRFN